MLKAFVRVSGHWRSPAGPPSLCRLFLYLDLPSSCFPVLSCPSPCSLESLLPSAPCNSYFIPGVISSFPSTLVNFLHFALFYFSCKTYGDLSPDSCLRVFRSAWDLLLLFSSALCLPSGGSSSPDGCCDSCSLFSSGTAPGPGGSRGSQSGVPSVPEAKRWTAPGVACVSGPGGLLLLPGLPGDSRAASSPWSLPQCSPDQPSSPAGLRREY